jgi:hypothetical protein
MERRKQRCSFCGKPQDKDRRLVAGPGAYICDRCVKLCMEVLEQDRRARPRPGAGGGRWVRVTGGRVKPLARLRRGLGRLFRRATPSGA